MNTPWFSGASRWALVLLVGSGALLALGVILMVCMFLRPF